MKLASLKLAVARREPENARGRSARRESPPDGEAGFSREGESRAARLPVFATGCRVTRCSFGGSEDYVMREVDARNLITVS